ncbi:MAG: 2'-deoxycytidine 5'-triphosphate deaminase, partial [Planctomycetes bacterium]|nr:2'-deoxycytidine 5'-triphosphate deaminase [Planctomycetota bacterium]
EAYTHSKSSTGRIDLATRVIADSSPRYDRIPDGYNGDLWIELIPKSFDVVAQAGASLNQAIFFRDRHILDQSDMLELYNTTPLLYNPDGKAIAAADCVYDGRLMMTADLSADVVGFVAKRSHLPLDLKHLNGHQAHDFFTPIPKPSSGYLFLEKDSFYILATHEQVVVPDNLACEMVPYDAASGEFRAHYAGFFDPGWGIFDGEHRGTCAVLEVRPHEDDLILRHGQPICAMAFEKLIAPCTRLYGKQGNNYHGQIGPRLSKHFL